MKMGRIAMGLIAALGLILGSVLPASAQSSRQFEGFYCQLDLASANIARPPGVAALQTTTDSRKVCTGDITTENILLECRKRIANWPRTTVTRRGIPCMVNAAPCGIAGFLDDPFTSSLDINSTGRALLKCQFTPS